MSASDWCLRFSYQGDRSKPRRVGEHSRSCSRKSNAQTGKTGAKKWGMLTHLNPRIAAAEISLRRLARTSERTSMRCSSRPLIVTKSNLCLPNLIFGRVVCTFQLSTNRTLQLCAYTSCWRPIEMFLCAPDRNVSIDPSDDSQSSRGA
jgi:hypothetical protein